MQRMKTVIKLILPLMLIFSLALAGCSSSSSNGKKQTVKIAFIAPLTGDNSRIGLGGKNSAQLAVTEANRNKKNKYHYKLESFDNEGTTQGGQQVALKASSDPSIIGGIGHYMSVVALAALPTYHKNKLPMIIWGAVHPAITYGNNYKEIFRVPGTQIDQNATAAKFILNKGYKKVAIIYTTDDYGEGHYKYFTENFKKLGGTVVDSEGIQPDANDVTAQLTKMAAKKPDLIWYAGLAPEGVHVKKQMDSKGIKVQFMGCSGLVNSEFNTALGSKAAEGTISIIDGAPISQLKGGTKFEKDYQAQHFKEDHEAYGPFAYASTNLLIKAIEAVGPNRSKIITWLNTKVKNVPSLVGDITFDSHGQNKLPLYTPMISQNGKWIPFSESDYQKGKRKLIKP